MAARGKTLTTASQIAESIQLVRGQKVLLDSTLASLYGVQTKVLVQAVKRNRDRFPADFMFELSNHEVADLRSQFVTSSWGGRRYLPFAFTEQGVAMLSSVLNSPQAIRINIEIMRAFVQLREMIATNKELSGKLDELERKVATHDQAIAGLINAIRELAMPIPTKSKRRIGFVIDP
ncbi:MAG: ORF6N domain-containing protein [Betaproteobacteria bacterium]